MLQINSVHWLEHRARYSSHSTWPNKHVWELTISVNLSGLCRHTFVLELSHITTDYQQNMMSLHSVNLSIFIIFWIKTNDILCDNHWSNRQTCSLYGAEWILFWERSAFNPSCISHSLSPLHFDGLSQRKNYTYQIFYKSRGAPWLRAVHRPL